MRRTCLGAGTIAAALIFLTAPSDAGQGQTTNSSLYCQRNQWGGYCWGNFWSTHYQSQSSDYVDFSQGSDRSTTGFHAVAGGSYYTCRVALDNTALLNWWPNVLLATKGFTIQWDANGLCNWVLLDNDSRAGTAW